MIIFFCNQTECQNYIRVIAKTEKSRMLICGTHAFKPRCRHYKYKVAVITVITIIIVITIDTIFITN